MRVLLVKPVTAFCEVANKIVTLDPKDCRREPSGSISDDVRITGLVAPHPETLKKGHLSLYVGMNEKKYTLCLTDEQINTCLLPLLTPQVGQIFKAKKDTSGNDNSYNSPSRVDIPAGSLLLACSDQGTNRGDYFMGLFPKDTDPASIKRDHTTKLVHASEGRTFHPYDVNHLDPRYFELLT